MELMMIILAFFLVAVNAVTVVVCVNAAREAREYAEIRANYITADMAELATKFTEFSEADIEALIEHQFDKLMQNVSVETNVVYR